MYPYFWEEGFQHHCSQGGSSLPSGRELGTGNSRFEGFSLKPRGQSWERDWHSHWHVKECMIVDDNTTFSFNPIKHEGTL